MQQHQSILSYRRGRYLKIALVLCIGSIAGYAWHQPPTSALQPYGGTYLGYTLGTIGAVLIVWLMLLGVRKRSYRAAVGTLQGWTSAHVYLGISLLIVVTLHCAFQFGWNVHTLAYAFMVAVIVSGFFGIHAYLSYPERLTRNIGNDTYEALAEKIAELDRKCRRIALDLPDEINDVVAQASRVAERERGDTRRLWLPRRLRPHATAIACGKLKKIGTRLTGNDARLNAQLLTEMSRKRHLIDRMRSDVRYRTLLQLWLYAHVPLSFALLAALIAHVVSVFYYW